mmetsp:Transcript_111072/g.301446  ORF Transcript_111072/g.301446 Transcript_111072/m.301446 type:complete len:82 (+) Transcript_111072:134-379(+)
MQPKLAEIRPITCFTKGSVELMATIDTIKEARKVVFGAVKGVNSGPLPEASITLMTKNAMDGIDTSRLMMIASAAADPHMH